MTMNFFEGGTHVSGSAVLGETMAGSVTPPLGGSAWLRPTAPTTGGTRGDAMAAELGRLPRAEDVPERLLVFDRDKEPGETVPDPGGFGVNSFGADGLSSLPPVSASLLLPNSFDMNLVYSLALLATGLLGAALGLFVSEPLDTSAGGTL